MKKLATSDPYYYITREWPKGNIPAFFDNNQYPMTKILEENAETIINEIIDFYQKSPSSLKTNFVPYDVDTTGWNTLMLYSYGATNKKAQLSLPKTWSLLKGYPGLGMVLISALEPRKTIGAHFGDTDAIVRNHLGIVIPEPYPKIGIRVKTDERGWERGKVLSFSVLNRHRVWNHSDSTRIVLIVDFIKPELAHRKWEIQGKTLAAQGMKLIATKLPITKKLPPWFLRRLHIFLGLCANIYTNFYLNLRQ